MSRKQKRNYYIQDEVHNKIIELKNKQGFTIDELLEDMITQYLSKEDNNQNNINTKILRKIEKEIKLLSIVLNTLFLHNEQGNKIDIYDVHATTSFDPDDSPSKLFESAKIKYNQIMKELQQDKFD